MPGQALQQGDRTLCLNAVATDAQLHNRVVVELQHFR